MTSFRVLIIGYGSIGKRHFEVLSKLKKINDIKVITNNKISPKKKISLKKEDLIEFNPDYIVISSATISHYKHLKFINDIFNNKVILVEKPIFHSRFKKLSKIKNKIFVGYNLRYHPLLIYLKSELKFQKKDLL